VPGLASSAVKVRPAMGRIPSRSKNETLTDWPVIRSAAPEMPVSVMEAPETAAIDENVWFCSLQSRKLSGETRLRNVRADCSQSETIWFCCG